MSSKYFNQYGELCQGYYCVRCGETCNMYATGHGEGKCLANFHLVKQLERANPMTGKPHFVARIK